MERGWNQINETGYDRGGYHDEPSLVLVDNFVATNVRLTSVEIKGFRMGGGAGEFFIHIPRSGM